MTIRVNGVVIDDAAVEKELPLHTQADSPLDSAKQTLVLRELLLQRAAHLGIAAESPEQTMELLIDREVTPAAPDEAACRAFFEEHRDSFVRDELIEASHILFQLSDAPDPQLLRTTAEMVLMQIRVNSAQFEELAREYSACPSGDEGGKLGQIARGQTVPAFEAALFALGENQLCEQLVETEFGLHIIKSGAHIPGGPLAFEEAHEHLATFLTEIGLREAMQHYLLKLAADAQIEGYTLPSA